MVPRCHVSRCQSPQFWWPGDVRSRVFSRPLHRTASKLSMWPGREPRCKWRSCPPFISFGGFWEGFWGLPGDGASAALGRASARAWDSAHGMASGMVSDRASGVSEGFREGFRWRFRQGFQGFQEGFRQGFRGFPEGFWRVYDRVSWVSDGLRENFWSFRQGFRGLQGGLPKGRQALYSLCYRAKSRPAMPHCQKALRISQSCPFIFLLWNRFYPLLGLNPCQHVDLIGWPFDPV